MSVGEPTHPTAALPLCVDLDGTLIATDTLWESLLLALRHRPGVLLRLPGWLLRGRARLKAELAAAAALDPATLPYREEVVAYLGEARAAGRPLALATASDRRIAAAVAEHLGGFERVIASDGDRNLKGSHKREALDAAFGERGYEYVGDARADRSVWAGAARASAVGISPAQLQAWAGEAALGRQFPVRAGGLGTWLRALRLHQWVKNVLVFVPLVLAHRIREPELLASAGLAFLCLSLMASAVYVINDLFDLAADRVHPVKRRRPFAAGTLPIAGGLALLPLLVGVSLGIAGAWLPTRFAALLLGYLMVNLLYSTWLKRVAIADVIFLAGLYSLRVLAGGIVTGIVVSPWLMGFSLFFFLQLAFLKRYADLRLSAEHEQAASPGRDYRLEDAPLLLSLGPAAGYMAVVILALYLQSEKVAALYRSPDLLWGIVPLLVFWTSRIWLFAHRGRVREDPVIFTTRDPTSWAVGVACAGVLFAASWLTTHAF